MSITIPKEVEVKGTVEVEVAVPVSFKEDQDHKHKSKSIVKLDWSFDSTGLPKPVLDCFYNGSCGSDMISNAHCSTMRCRQVQSRWRPEHIGGIKWLGCMIESLDDIDDKSSQETICHLYTVKKRYSNHAVLMIELRIGYIHEFSRRVEPQVREFIDGWTSTFAQSSWSNHCSHMLKNHNIQLPDWHSLTDPS